MRLKKILTSLVTSLALAQLTVHSEQEKNQADFVKSSTLDVSVASEYLAGKAGFRVVNHPVVQTYGDVTSPLGTFYEWSNFRIAEGDVNELDLGWVSPPIDGKYLGGNMMLAGYTYPNSENNWGKWDLEIGANIFTQNLPVNANLYAGFNSSQDKKSGVAKLSMGKSIAIKENRLSLEGAVAYSDKYYSEYAGASHATLRAELARPLGKEIEIYGGITLQEPLNSFGGQIKEETVGFIGARYKLK